MNKQHEEQLRKIAEEQLNAASLNLLDTLLAEYKDLNEENINLLNANKEYEEVLSKYQSNAKELEEDKQEVNKKLLEIEKITNALENRAKAITERENTQDLHDKDIEIKHLKEFNERLNSYNSTLFANKSINHMINISGNMPAFNIDPLNPSYDHNISQPFNASGNIE